MPKEDSDRRLLELAALAAGITGEWSTTIGGWPCLVRPHGGPWQPLHDDGDAQRLAVKLGLLVDMRYTAPEMARYNGVTYWPTPMRGVSLDFGDRESDPYAATRRAIVRAAAEIGLALENEGKKNA